MVIVLLVLASIVALPSAAVAGTEVIDDVLAVDASAPRPQRPFQLETRLFEMREGRAFEVAFCDRHEQVTWAPYACWAFNLGKQDGSWVGGDLLTLGVRFRPYRGPISFIAGAGFGIGMVTVNGLLSALCAGPPSDGPKETAGSCDPAKFLPVELAAELGIRTRVHAGRMGVELQALGRVHAPHVARWGRSMAGPMASVGVGLTF